MACICVFDLKEIRHSGCDIGDDWEYIITIDGIMHSISGSGHGKRDENYKVEHRWTLEEKPCGTTVEIPLNVRAEEADLFFDDKGTKSRVITIKSPTYGAPLFRLSDQKIKVDVRERPGFLSGVNFVTFVFDIKVLYIAD